MVRLVVAIGRGVDSLAVPFGCDQDGEVVGPPCVGGGLPGVGTPLQHQGHIDVRQLDGAMGTGRGLPMLATSSPQEVAASSSSSPVGGARAGHPHKPWHSSSPTAVKAQGCCCRT